MSLNVDALRNPLLKDWATKHLNSVGKVIYLGTPVVADDDRIVVSANMKVGSYTIAANPDVARSVSVTHTAVDAADTLGTITLSGKNILGETQTETITPSSGTTVYSTKMWGPYDITVTGAGWVIAGGNDTIKVGVGPKLGLPIELAATSEVMFSIVGTAIVDPTVVAGGTVATSSIDASSGTYNGSKKVFAVVVE